MTSLQNLNAKLLTKIKQTEEENLELKQPSEPQEVIKLLEEDKKKLIQKIRELEAHKLQSTNH